MLRRKKKPEEDDRRDKKKNLERDRLEKAEEAYLERLANSIRGGNLYVSRPKSPLVVEPQPEPPQEPVPQTPPRPGYQWPTAGNVRRDPPTSPQTPLPLEGLENLSPAILDKVIKPATPVVASRPPASQPPPATSAYSAPEPYYPPPVPPPAAPQPPPAPSAPATSQPYQTPPPAQPADQPIGTFPRGTILQLEDGTIAVYKDPVKGKEYEIVYALRSNGKLRPEGIALYAYESKKIGRIPDDIFEDLQKTLRWDRDVICFHLDKYEYCSLIPLSEYSAPAAAGAAAGGGTGKTSPTGKVVMPDPPTSPLLDPARELVKGRRVYISFGPGKTWEAVYWGKDLLGHVVAHHTNNQWALMHLDIKRFRDSIEIGEILRDEDVKAIQQDILTAQDRDGGA